MTECEGCRNGIHKHLEGINLKELDKLPFYEKMEAMDCKEVFYDKDGNSTGQCICHLRTIEYNKYFGR